ncbi:MAG TPA: tetratricopeptide repeat protein [Afifellaceae bacterium]|nr:tetratricopeptide repeat protein [Afifellaceae bacterium]
MMRRLLVLSLVAGLAAPALAQTAPSERPAPQSLAELPMDGLFAGLAASPGDRAAKRFEAEIVRRFHRSGSDTADLLLSWADRALKEKEYGPALDLLDRIVLLRPEFAEAWNKRATIHFLRKDFGKALADIERTLRLEPRHFGALSGLAVILREVGRTETAMSALRQALEIHPHLEDARDLLEKLEAGEAGRDI